MVRCIGGLLAWSMIAAGGPTWAQLGAPETAAVVLVLRPDGAPAADTETFVWAWRQTSSRHWAGGYSSVRTDSDGRLEVTTRFPETANGDVPVRADGLALICPSVGWCVLSAEELAEGGDQGVEAWLKPGGTVHVRCHTADGTPQPEQMVSVSGVPGWQIGSLTETRQADAEGVATFGLLPPGLYEVSAPGPGVTTQHVMVSPGDEVEVDVWSGALSRRVWHAAVDSEGELGELTGVALNADGEPLAGAVVWVDLLPLESSWAGSTTGRRTETDASGRFTLAGVRPGYHTVAVLAGGATVALHPLYVGLPGEREPVVVRAVRPTGKVVGRVIEHGTEQGLDGVTVVAIEQRYLRQQSADIARRVPRRPRAGVRRAVSTGDSMPESDLQAVLAEASTRPDGSYEIAGLLPGAYAVAAIGAESGRDGVGPVFVTGDSTTRAPDLWLPRREGIPVRVRLVTEAGEPLGQQMVELTARGGGAEGSIVAQGPVDETGLLTLRATSPGWYGFSLRCSDGSEAQCWGVPVTAQGSTVEPTLTARRPARGRATVRIITPDGVPVSQCVWVFPVAQPGGESGDAADFGRTTPTDAEGVCVFEGLEPGPYMFVAQTPHTLETDGSERQIAVSPVVVVPPDGSAHVVAVLERLVRVAGRVCSPDGTETGPFLISASSSCGLALWPWLRRGTVSDNTGEFVLDGLYPGRWEVSAQPLDPLPYMWVETRWASPTPGGMEWVELTGRLPNDREEDPDEAAPITVTGRVVQRDGSPAAGAIVGWAENGATPAHQVLAGPGGEFSLPGVVGSQPRVLAWTPDGQVANRMLDTRGGQFPGQVTDPPPLELSLAPMPAITGWVVTPPGDPATSCIDVVAEPTQIWDTSGPWPAGTMCARVHAGPDGAFAIEGLKPGEYSVTAVWGTLRRTAPVVVDTFQGGVGGLVLTAEPLVPTLRLRLENDRSRPLAPGQPLGVSVNGSRLAGPMALVDGWVELCHTPPGLYQVWLVALAHDGTLTGSGDVTPLTSELSVRPSQWPRLRGRVVAAPGHGLHSGLRVALCSADQWMGSPTYYWDIEPDGTYDVPTRVAGELEVSLVAGRATRLAMHRVTVTDQAVTEVPDLVYAGLPSD